MAKGNWGEFFSSPVTQNFIMNLQKNTQLSLPQLCKWEKSEMWVHKTVAIALCTWLTIPHS